MASSNVAFLMGLVRCSVQPAAKLRSLASSKGMGGQQKNGRDAERADLASGGIAIQDRHFSVHKHQVIGALFESIDGLCAVFHFINGAAGILQIAADEKAVLLGIVSQKNSQSPHPDVFDGLRGELLSETARPRIAR